MQTCFVFKFVVDRLDVGNADSLLHLDPAGGPAQNLAETLKLRHGVVRAAGVQPRRHKVRTTFAPHHESCCRAIVDVRLRPRRSGVATRRVSVNIRRGCQTRAIVCVTFSLHPIASSAWCTANYRKT